MNKDNVGVTLIKAAWNTVVKPLRNLYKACLRLGYYPEVWREVVAYILPKAGDRNLIKINLYRPISLLPYLAKGLNKLVTRRIAVLAVKYEVYILEYFRGYPARLTTDLTAYLVYDVKRALIKGKVATLFTKDVSGAFNAVYRNRLTRRIKK